MTIFKNSILFENTTSLGFVQIANYVIPLVMIPYLIRVLGPSNYGLMSFAYAFIQYFITFVDYGFNIYATREISLKKEQPGEVSIIVSTVLVIKTALTIVCFITMLLLVISFAKLKDDIYIYMLTYTAVLGNVLFPVWLYQGLEKMKIIAVLNGVAKITGAVLVLIFVKNPSDIYLAVAFQSTAVIFAGLISIVYAYKIYPLKLSLPSIKNIFTFMAKGWAVFISILSVSIIGNSAIFILGLYRTHEEVGLFAIAQKIIWAVVNLTNPVSTAAFPRVGQLFNESRIKALKLLKKILLFGSIIFGAASIILFVGADLWTSLFTGKVNNHVVLLIRIMSVMPLLIVIDNVWGMQIMLNRGMDRQFMFTYLLGSIVAISISFILVPTYGAIGSSLSLLISEIIILLLLYHTCSKNGFSIDTLLKVGE